MAIRYRKGRASPWQCYWNNPLTGKRECANFISQHEAEKHDSLIKHRIKFDRESFKQGGEDTDKPEVLTLEACYLMYLREKQFSKKNLRCHLSAMREILRKYGARSIVDISKKEISAIIEEMQKNSKNETVHKKISLFRAVIRWSAERGYREEIDFPRLPKVHYQRFIPPSPEELQTIMQYAAPHVVRVIILGAQCGVRVGPSELFRLTWADVDIKRRLLRVHGAKKNLNASWREVPIRESLVPIFEVWKREDDDSSVKYLIHHRGQPVEKIKKAWAGALRRAGITRRIRPYDLRHAFATEMIASGVDIGTVAKLMGHSSPTMLLNHYQYVMDGQKRAAVEALPELPHVPIFMCPKKKAFTRYP